MNWASEIYETSPALVYMGELLAHGQKKVADEMYQAMMNNLWGNNPGELERWEDDGGK